MARKRMIDPEFWSDETMGNWSVTARLCYIGLWSLADDEGRFKADVGYVQAQIFPYDDPRRLKFSSCWVQVSRKLVLYEVNGQKYGYIPNFFKYQRIDHPTKSKLPAPPDEISRNFREPFSPNIIEVKLNEDNLAETAVSARMNKLTSEISQTELTNSTEIPVSQIETSVFTDTTKSIRVIEDYPGQRETVISKIPKEPKEPKVPDDVSHLISCFSSAYQAKVGISYACNILRDKKIFSIILKTGLSVEEIKLRIGRFFATDNEYIIERQYTLTLFEYNINNFGQAKKKPRVDRI